MLCARLGHTCKNPEIGKCLWFTWTCWKFVNTLPEFTSWLKTNAQTNDSCIMQITICILQMKVHVTVLISMEKLHWQSEMTLHTHSNSNLTRFLEQLRLKMQLQLFLLEERRHFQYKCTYSADCKLPPAVVFQIVTSSFGILSWMKCTNHFLRNTKSQMALELRTLCVWSNNSKEISLPLHSQLFFTSAILVFTCFCTSFCHIEWQLFMK